MSSTRLNATDVLPGPLDERSALLRARRGDREAFRILVVQHQARVHGITLRLTGLPDEAARLAQDVFIALHSALPRIASPGHLTRWVLRETMRRVLHQVRTGGADMQGVQEDAADGLPPRRLLLQLPPDARAILLLRFQEGLDPGEIAAVLDVGEPLVAHSLQRSLDWMAAQAAPDETELESRLRASLVAPDPGPNFTERVLAHVELRRSHRRRSAFLAVKSAGHRRIMLAGAILLMLSGAAWLGFQLYGTGMQPAATPAAVQTAPAEAGPAEASPEPELPEQIAALPPLPEPVQPPDVYPRYTVIAAPLRQQSPDAAAWPAIEAFHAALLDELRKLPGVTLLVPGVTAPPGVGAPRADYLLSVTGLATTLPSGGEGFRVGNGLRAVDPLVAADTSSGMVMLPAMGSDSPPRWPVEIRIEPIGSVQSRGHVSVVLVGPDAASLAAQQIAALQLRFFPDVLARQRLAAIIRNDALAPSERDRALSALLGMLARSEGAGLDSQMVATIQDRALMLPADQRAQVWRNLRGLRNPEMVRGLIDSARHDQDEQVRFEALATLVADYAAEPAVQAAIAAVAEQDAEEVLRMAAGSVAQGGSTWNAFVLARLGDTGILPDQRMEPLLLVARSATTPAEQAALQGLLSDPEVMRALLGLVGDGWFDPMQIDATADALELLAHADNAAAYDLLVQMPRAAPPLATPSAVPEPDVPGPDVPEVAPVRPQVSAANLAWLRAHRDNPRARRLLQDVESGRADARINAMIEQMRRMEQRGRLPTDPSVRPAPP